MSIAHEISNEFHAQRGGNPGPNFLPIDVSKSFAKLRGGYEMRISGRNIQFLYSDGSYFSFADPDQFADHGLGNPCEIGYIQYESSSIAQQAFIERGIK